MSPGSDTNARILVVDDNDDNRYTLTERLKQVGHASRDPLTAQPLQFAMDSGLIHGESVLLINLETCTRCDECVRACADMHDGIPRFIREGVKFRNFSVPTACSKLTGAAA